MLKLPNITLCTFGSTNVEGMKQALEYSSRGIEWGDVKCIEHPCNGIDEWNKNVVFELGSYIKTDFALLIHPDGFVVNPDSWKDEFMDYDYIGSPWPLPTDSYSYRDRFYRIQRVGNSVSLRSKKLLDLPKALNMEWKSFHGFSNEDGYICVNMRDIFEAYSCKFAPFELAVKFGRETTLPEHEGVEPFVFHRHAGENSKYPNFENE